MRRLLGLAVLALVVAVGWVFITPFLEAEEERKALTSG